jgi:hypothetical protein
MVKSILTAAIVTGMVLSSPAWAVTGANSNDTGGNAGATGNAAPGNDTSNAGTAAGATATGKLDPTKKPPALGTVDTSRATKGGQSGADQPKQP